MNDSPRGTYTPHNDQPLSFDARAPVRGSRPVPMTLIVSAVIGNTTPGTLTPLRSDNLPPTITFVSA